MMFFVEKDLTEEGRSQFRHTLENPPQPKHLRIVPKTGDKSTFVPVDKKKWRAPPGWTPPGWDETKSYAVAKSFMGFKSNPK